MSQWCRLWADMPTDPKFRVIAKRAGRPVSEVLAVFVHMLANATERSERSAERGELSGWDDEAVGIAIDAESDHVAAIREAMQGRLLDDQKLTGWERRQPLREDNSADRARAWREAQKQKRKPGSPEIRTDANATERDRTLEESRVEEIREEKIDTSLRSVGADAPARAATPPQPRGSRIDPAWIPDSVDRDYAAEHGLSEADVAAEAEKFRDHWLAKSGEAGRKADWRATWRTWCRNAVEFRNRDHARAGTVSGAPQRRPTHGVHSAMAGIQAAMSARRDVS